MRSTRPCRARRPLGALALLLTLAGSPAPGADWAIYHVYLPTYRNGDRANDGAGITGWRDPRYAGGDLAGLLASLDEIAALGFDALWISPMFAARSSHGYDVTDYLAIGEAVGVAGDPAASLALWRRLRDAAHARGLRVLLDLPLNHAARGYDLGAGDPWGLHPRATSARQPAERTWESWGAGYRYWDFGHAPTREFLRRVARHWLVEEQADGLRLDYARGVPLDFWRELAAEVEARAPGKLLLAECWADELGAEGNVEVIAECAGGLPGPAPFGSLLDFPLQIALTDAFSGKAPASAVARVLDLEQRRWGRAFRPARFLDNHDLARFVDRVGDRRALVAALAFAAAQSGPLVVYYGTEAALGGGPSAAGFTDGGRLPMPASGAVPALRDEVAALLALRRAHPALAAGERRGRLAERALLVEEKRSADELLLVATNFAEAERVLALTAPAGAIPDATPQALFGPPPAWREGELAWALPPRTTAIARLATAAGAER